ncbi:peptidase [Paracoccus aestuariivivens]|uniref:Peptidase n=1 Tax=Paracoccus aestuariivivens TaxID=1820333 RepID=A0A6L6JB51_9RHOB|nr:peptidase [Paracoccus aestuariivivens]MTH77211.1 peptidase [Paracoccus aestuariivivens]
MRDAIVKAARAWIGTPYVHQASARGAGTDCLGLVRGVWRELYGDEPELLPAYTPDWGEMLGEELLIGGARRLLLTSDIEAAGDVLIFRMRSGVIAKHMGILAQIGDRATFIHSYDRRGVVESPLSIPWRSRIAGRFRFPPLN